MLEFDYLLFRQYFFVSQWLALALVLFVLKTTDISVAAVSFFIASLFLLLTYLNYIEYENKDVFDCMDTKTRNACSCNGDDRSCFISAFESDPEWLRYKRDTCNGEKPSSKSKLIVSYGDIRELKNRIDAYTCDEDDKNTVLQNYLTTDEYNSSISGFTGLPWPGFAFICVIIFFYMFYQWSDAAYININKYDNLRSFFSVR